MNPLARANRFSWWAAAALAALALLTYLLSPRIPGLSQWQLQSGFKNLTGYLLLALLVGMWLPTWLRQRFNRPTQLDWIKLSHQWLGVGFWPCWYCTPTCCARAFWRCKPWFCSCCAAWAPQLSGPN